MAEATVAASPAAAEVAREITATEEVTKAAAMAALVMLVERLVAVAPAGLVAVRCPGTHTIAGSRSCSRSSSCDPTLLRDHGSPASPYTAS